MAESSSQPAGDLLITAKEELTSPRENILKDLATPAPVTVATEAESQASRPDVRAEASGPAAAAAAKAPTEETALTPEPPSSPSTENGTPTAATTEEESLSALLGGVRAEGGAEPGVDQDPDVDLDLEESSSVATAGGSDDQQQSSDSASFSIPSLELSDGNTATGNSLDVDEALSSSYSALGAEGCSPSTDAPSLRDDEAAAATATAGGATAAAAAAAAAPEPEPSMPAYYLVKWITWKEKKTPIITQSENGPCPLLAIMNTLFLRWKAKLPAQTEVITTEDLMAHLGECVLSVTPREKADGMELNFQQNMSDAMAVLPKLSTGLDVNVRFTGVTDFEYTPECIVFDLLDIPLYHGWLVDPQSPEMVAAVGKLSYNQLVEKIIDYKHSADSSRVSEGLVAEQFLEATATQLSYHGLCELNTTAKEGEISVFFRNNHFSTMIKHKGHLYLLVTDQGFLQEDGLVWESLHNVEGDGNFCDSDFRLCHPPQRATPSGPLPPASQQQQRQIHQDYLVAMSLQQQQQAGAPGPLSDLELARQLQQEEYQQQQQQQQPGAQPQPQVRGQASGQQGGARRRDKDSDCVVL
ncbi:ubiquitin carboxyl-terminal hydrolase MINDY-1 [Myripristis murdjan]|uniref:Ubiquitin carboxyl-terminal hydrolase n=1 Tax=Myripristis murdjan TaxID=586833 RepID=A0A667YPC0_9TELE|nr:ubiquitin carboxyl-terminal hydrolase MINDY-1 [Myripristis murdjan]XP_029919545.1 ubiquitin carboxyl-terminal hydrolase MINDY-1 [Myripristis murdjan]